VSRSVNVSNRHGSDEPFPASLTAFLTAHVQHRHERQHSGHQTGQIAIALLAQLAAITYPKRKLAIRSAHRHSLEHLSSDQLHADFAQLIEPAIAYLATQSPAIASRHISRLYELLLSASPAGKASSRTTQGAFYTPAPLVDHLVSQTIAAPPPRRPLRICDPACGTGNFLLAAGAALQPSAQAWQSLYGVDIDPAAVMVCRWRIWLASGCIPNVWKAVCRNICIGDSLGSPPPSLNGSSLRAWQTAAPAAPALGHSWMNRAELRRAGTWRGFDIILGNPPFLSQLASQTAHDTQRQAWLRYRYPNLVGPYTDAAAIFLAHAVELLAPGGQLGLVLPSSVLSTRDCADIRRYTAAQTSIQSVWINPARSFPGVNVLTCALVASKADQSESPPATQRIQTFAGPNCTKGPLIVLKQQELTNSSTWGMLTQGLSGLPTIRISRQHTLADIAHATADFRDQYYGLQGHIADIASAPDQNFAPLITSGLIDLACSNWGQRPTRILKHLWQAPQANLKTLRSSTALGTWIDQRRVPKVLLATQTRILEPWVDLTGTSLPCVPLITLIPRDGQDPQSLWFIGSILASPVVSALARMECAGAALSAAAIKISAKQCLTLPLPQPKLADRFASAFAKVASPDASPSDLEHFAHTSMEGYPLSARKSQQILRWWLPLATQSRFKSQAENRSHSGTLT
jgi:hypothetical protein